MFLYHDSHAWQAFLSDYDDIVCFPDKERNYISSVFHNRLKRDIALYCDPTVRYAVKKFKGRITYSDLKFGADATGEFFDFKIPEDAKIVQ